MEAPHPGQVIQAFFLIALSLQLKKKYFCRFGCPFLSLNAFRVSFVALHLHLFIAGKLPENSCLG